MKALSIIAIVLSAISLIVSFKIADPEPTRVSGLFLLTVSIYFLAFSITALAKASKRKTD